MTHGKHWNFTRAARLDIWDLSPFDCYPHVNWLINTTIYFVQPQQFIEYATSVFGFANQLIVSKIYYCRCCC